MTKIETLEKEIEGLSPQEMRAFRRWFEEFDAELWDRELERDVVAWKLDRLADAAVAAHKRGEAETLRHHATPEFWGLFDQLPETVRDQALIPRISPRFIRGPQNAGISSDTGGGESVDDGDRQRVAEARRGNKGGR
jgi:hypothetical protein